MPQSLSFLLVHLVFSTRDRVAWLSAEMRSRLHAYMATVVRDMGCECYRVGGTADHVHLAVRLSRTVAVADAIEKLKTVSTKWVKAQASTMAGFSWQRGYGAFSVGPSDLEALVGYIDGQEEHHRVRSYEEEYRTFLKRYGIEFDERWVWD